MIKILYFIIPICISLYYCTAEQDKKNIEKWKQEILETEKSFAKMAKEEGIYKAFISYAAEDAVLMRNNDLVVGKNNIDLFYENQTTKGLAWIPDFVEVAASGDLGYTYGEYTFSFIDSNGDAKENKGIFHTVWKRQPDGIWRFVWD